MLNGIFITLVIFSFVIYIFLKNKRQRQMAFIQALIFPEGLNIRLKESYPHLTEHDIELVLTGLRDFLLFCHQARNKMVSMPSQVVDDAWHELILFTRTYELLCKKAFGRFLHHTPTESMSTPTVAQEGIKRAWRLACAQSNINPKKPQHLPLLFALDEKLKIEAGFIYSLNCKDKSSGNHGFCATHIGCSSGCSGTSGSSSTDGGSFSGFGDSSDGGGSSCGGGD